MAFVLPPLHCRFVLNSRNCQVKISRQVRYKIVELCQIPARHCPPARSRLTHNVPAALRGRGAHKCLGGRHTCKFAQMFGRAYTPALAKPPVIGWSFLFLVILSTLFFCYSDIIVFTIPKVFFVKFHFKLFQ